MTTDRQFRELEYDGSEIRHEYGEDVHLYRDPLALSRLAQLCSPEVEQPKFNRLIDELYRKLLWNVVNAEFPRRDVEVPTRMRESTDRGVYRGEVIDPETSVVIVDVARAGIVPSESCFRMLNEILEPNGVRQDHLFMERTTDETGSVTGVEISGAKVGRRVDADFVLVPDPMGATGSSMTSAISYFKDEVGTGGATYVAMNLIITPEYIRGMREVHPDAPIHGFRLDRGTSPADVFETIPGERWSAESGLDENDYIVPGGGGFGELMNNSRS